MDRQECARMNAPAEPFDVAVVGGAGHVGAPLSILLAHAGLRTLIYDLNTEAMERLADGDMPFAEDGAVPLLRTVLVRNRLRFSSDPDDLAGVPYLVVTIGTPIDEFHNPVLRVVTDCIQSLMPHLDDAQTIILRSTVFPGVTEYVERFLRANGKKTKVAFCPERVVQGRAIPEIPALPQIVSGTTPEAEAAAAALFGRIAPAIVRMAPREAEFAKLICNAYRYIQFAAANQFYMMAEAAGLNYDRVLAGLKQDYPRARDLPGPGFAAGPCLMKDTMQLFAFSNQDFQLGHAAMLANEGLPNFLVEQLRRRRDLTRTTVGILGMAFKANIDDTRESLAFKLAKILRFHGAVVLCSDEFVRNTSFVSKEQLMEACDVAIVAAPHAVYAGLDIPAGVELIDLWGVVRGGWHAQSMDAMGRATHATKPRSRPFRKQSA
jgi:UDP-N-acetyl-D-mannosaminuronic acid dehydrogenase